MTNESGKLSEQRMAARRNTTRPPGWKGAKYTLKKQDAAAYQDRQQGLHEQASSPMHDDDKRTWEMAVDDVFSLNRGPTPSSSRLPDKFARLPDNQRDDMDMPVRGAAAWDLTEEEASDWFLRTIPRLSHIITCYSETVLLSRDYLQARNGQLTNLEHMIYLSNYKKEWSFLEERFREMHQLNRDFDLL